MDGANSGGAGGERYLRVKEACEYVGLKLRKFQRRVSEGLILKVKDGRTVLIPVSSLEKYRRERDSRGGV